MAALGMAHSLNSVNICKSLSVSLLNSILEAADSLYQIVAGWKQSPEADPRAMC